MGMTPFRMRKRFVRGGAADICFDVPTKRQVGCVGSMDCVTTRQKARHMIATDRSAARQIISCQPGAIHT